MDLISIFQDAYSNFRFGVAMVVFLGYTAMDALYTAYTLAIVNKNKLAAANVGALMYLLVGIGTFSYVNNWLYIFPMAMGGWLGTYASLTYVEWKE